MTLQLVFDNPFPAKDFQRSDLVKLVLGGEPDVASNFLILDTYADGTVNDFQPLDRQGKPLMTSYYLLYDAGIKDFRRWLGETDQQILQRRARFIQFLKDSFNINITISNPEEASYVENSVDGVFPYSGLQKSGLRVVSSLGIAEPPLLARQYDNQRLVEMGFLYNSPEGVIKQGVYVIENYKGDPEQSIYGVPITNRINFQTKLRSTVNEVNQAAVVEDIFVDATDGRTLWQCQGTYVAVNIQYPETRHSEATRFRLRGTMRFGQCFNKDACDGRYCGTPDSNSVWGLKSNASLCCPGAQFCNTNFMCSKVSPCSPPRSLTGSSFGLYLAKVGCQHWESLAFFLCRFSLVMASAVPTRRRTVVPVLSTALSDRNNDS